jgi:hypothetical protein
MTAENDDDLRANMHANDVERSISYCAPHHGDLATS